MGILSITQGVSPLVISLAGH